MFISLIWSHCTSSDLISYYLSVLWLVAVTANWVAWQFGWCGPTGWMAVLTAMGTHVPYVMTQCYLSLSKGDIPAFTPANESWYSIAPKGCKAELSELDQLHITVVYSWNPTGPTPTPTLGMRLSCNFVNVYTIVYHVQYTYTCTRAHPQRTS